LKNTHVESFAQSAMVTSTGSASGSRRSRGESKCHQAAHHAAASRGGPEGTGFDGVGEHPSLALGSAGKLLVAYNKPPSEAVYFTQER
jgi:hypothetical protein